MSEEVINSSGATARGLWARFRHSFAANDHRSTDLIISVVAFALLAAMSHLVDTNGVDAWEVASFRSINGLPD